MAPILFHLGPIPVYGYGAMLLAAFLAGVIVLSYELRRKGISPSIARDITLVAIVFGVVGSKALSLLDEGRASSLPAWLGAWRDTMTWYGGLVAAMAAIFLYVWLRGFPLARIADAGAPALMLAYGIGRLGCHLAGDGDYGRPTDLPWAVRYDAGLVPPSRAFAGLPDLVASFPNGRVPDDIPCHPTPLYELGLAVLICVALLMWARRAPVDGSVFALYLVLSSAARFTIELLRLNPPVAFGLTEAQVIAAALALIGLGGSFYLQHRSLHTQVTTA
jgi:phosphatidylglycerol---prolipoprotein diacylglyceryl transferase